MTVQRVPPLGELGNIALIVWESAYGSPKPERDNDAEGKAHKQPGHAVDKGDMPGNRTCRDNLGRTDTRKCSRRLGFAGQHPAEPGKEVVRVLSDEFEPVSARTVTLSLMPRRDRATRRERRCGSA